VSGYILCSNFITEFTGDFREPGCCEFAGLAEIELRQFPLILPESVPIWQTETLLSASGKGVK
jgi:hypothetical protein